MKKLLLPIAILLSLQGCIGTGATTDTSNNENFDVVILNGRVMDPETKFDAVRNVGIKDGRIVSITENKISGSEIIDASGHVVAAGFIDYEQHGLDPFGIKVNLRDGVTRKSVV